VHVKEMRDAALQLDCTWRSDKPVSMISVIVRSSSARSGSPTAPGRISYGVRAAADRFVVIALIAILIATPISVIAAIYTNQFATEREKEIIKPVIEFIQAIPSVVLGFIGISLVGEFDQRTSAR
jgi:phosphate transport system permease protein